MLDDSLAPGCELLAGEMGVMTESLSPASDVLACSACENHC